MEGKIVQYLIAFSLSMFAISLGGTVSWLATASQKFYDRETSFEVTDNDISWLAAAISPGFLIGSLAIRLTLDRFGRRFTILAGIAPCAVSAVILVYATQGWLLCFSRFLYGIAFGLYMSVTSIYLAEVGDKDIRASLNLVTRFMLSFGQLFVLVIGPFVFYDTLNYILLTFPICTLITCWWIPESPYFYLKNGKVEDARRVLRKIRNKSSEEIDEELLELKLQVANEMRHSSSIKELLVGKQYRRALYISLSLKVTQIATGVLVFPHYITLIVKESNFKINLSTTFIIFGAINFAAGLISSTVVDRIGRRPLLTYTFMGTGVSLGAVCIYFFLLEVVHVDLGQLQPFSFIPYTGIVLAIVFSALGYNPLTNIVAAEIFPMNVKTIATVLLHIPGAITNTAVARGFKLIKDATGLTGVFAVYTVGSIAGVLVSIFLVLETKGKTLKEIQSELQGELYEPEEYRKKETDRLNMTDLTNLNCRASEKEALEDLIHKDPKENSKVMLQVDTV